MSPNPARKTLLGICGENTFMIAVNIDVHVSMREILILPGLGEEGGNTDVERRLNEVGDEGGVTFGNQCD